MASESSIEKALSKNWVKLLSLVVVVSSGIIGLYITNESHMRELQATQMQSIHNFDKHYESPTHSGTEDLIEHLVDEHSSRPHPVSVSKEDFNETRVDVKQLIAGSIELRLDQRLMKQSQDDIKEDIGEIKSTLQKIDDKLDRVNP